jgi:hypothetical protein
VRNASNNNFNEFRPGNIYRKSEPNSGKPATAITVIYNNYNNYNKYHSYNKLWPKTTTLL